MSEEPERGTITEVLKDLGSGDSEARERLAGLVGPELEKIAERCFRQERADHTLEPSALVNEVFLRLMKGVDVDWQGRTHFMAMSASMMRRILIDHAKAKNARKRGGGAKHQLLETTVASQMIASDIPQISVIVLNEALERLSQNSPRRARVVELRFFGGLSVHETAEAMGITEGVVKEHWTLARAWLHKELRSA